MKTKIGLLLLLQLLAWLAPRSAHAQGTAFTYQGRLNDVNGPASGVYDFKFTLHFAAVGAAQVGQTAGSSGVAVSNGLFTVTLDFGNQFPGAGRWLEIAVQTNGFNSFTTLAPRQPLTPTPYAITAGNVSGVLSNSSLPANAVFPGVVAASSFTGNGAGVTNVNAATLNGIPSGNFWQLGGNNVGAGKFLGSTNNQPLELRVNNQRGLRLETGGSNSVNVIGGYAGNSVAAGVASATVAGGGAGDYDGNVHPNRVEADGGTVSGGIQNVIQPTAIFATIAGGLSNLIETNAYVATIGGGNLNLIQSQSPQATIAGGAYNWIKPAAAAATIGGGNQNTIEANAVNATIGGGTLNTIQILATSATIGGGQNNNILAGSDSSVISGGSNNQIATNTPLATIGGGVGNTIQGGSDYTLIGGGSNNKIATDSPYATIAGGFANDISSNSAYSAIGGGNNNYIEAASEAATIAGGYANHIGSNSSQSVISGGGNTIAANSVAATIAGGVFNVIGRSADYGTIGGGYANTIAADSYASAIGGGFYNQIAANSLYATIPGGQYNTATNYAFAAGRRAKASSVGAFVWADSQDADFSSTAANQFCIRASGGVQLNTDTSVSFGSQTRQMLNLWSTNYGAGVQSSTLYFRSFSGFSWFAGGSHSDTLNDPGAGGSVRMRLDSGGLAVNGTFVSLSDRHAKENFAAVSAQEILAKVAALPITRWNFKEATGTPHLGPMAQDFHAAFGLGTDDRHIATVDADGVALAAIQGLNQKHEAEVKSKDARILELEQRLERLERLIEHQGNGGDR